MAGLIEGVRSTHVVTGARWRNWGRSVTATPRLDATVESVSEVRAVIAAARAAGIGLRPIGAGHSFSPIAATTGIQLHVDLISGLYGVDGTRVRVGAGTRLWQLAGLLEPYGLALQNMGDIDRQTVAGATSTGTHGTGYHFGGLATRIRGLTLVTGSGEVLRVTDQGENAELLPALAIGLGAYGVIVDVTLETVPEFALHAVERRMPLREVLGSWHELSTASDHFEFYLWPHSDIALTKSNTRLPGHGGLIPIPAASRFVDDELLGNGLFAGLIHLGAAAPRLTPRINRLVTSVVGDREFIDRSHRVYVSPRRVRFREMEYAVPFDAVPEIARDIVDLIERRRWSIPFPLEIRSAAEDDLWLSTATGRRTGYIAVHQSVLENPTEYFAAVEEILIAHAGRPHWGKMHTRDAEYLATVYPKFADAVALRDRLDPDRVFRNRYLDRVLGR